MASKTDIWMPLYIGDYLAATSHLSALESGAYLHLLMHQWKNGQLPSDLEALRRIARVDKDAWSNAWAMLKTFFDDATGAPVQHRLETIRDEWNEKKVKSQGKAKAAAEARWGKDAPSNAQAMPHPCPSSSSSPTPVKKEQKPLASTAIAVPAADRGDLLGTLPCTGGVDYEVRQDDLERDVGLFPGVDVLQEYRNMKAWLLASPKRQKTKSGVRRFMASWLTRAQDSPKQQGVQNGKFAGKTESSINAAHEAAAIFAEREAAGHYGSVGEAGDPAPSEVGHGRLLGAG